MNTEGLLDELEEECPLDTAPPLSELLDKYDIKPTGLVLSDSFLRLNRFGRLFRLLLLLLLLPILLPQG